MIRNVFSLALLIISVSLSIKHAWNMFDYKSNPTVHHMIKTLGIAETVVPGFSGWNTHLKINFVKWHTQIL